MVEVDDSDDDELVESMGKLQEMQADLAKIKEEERGKVLEVKSLYNEFRKALYNKRNEIIQSISDFWVLAFLSHPVLADRVSEEDKKVFIYLVSLEVEVFKEDSGYSITFIFLPYPFFEGTMLTKTYSMCEDGTTSVTSTIIKWKDGMNIASGSAQENKGAKRPITQDSFFNWLGEEQKILAIDVIDEVATIIREELWINPLNYIKNEADEEHADGGVSDDDKKEDDDKDVNGRGGNDADNDHDDEEDGGEDFNVSGSDDDDNNNDGEGKIIRDNDNINENEIEEQFDAQLNDGEENTEQDEIEEKEVDEKDED